MKSVNHLFAHTMFSLCARTYLYLCASTFKIFNDILCYLFPIIVTQTYFHLTSSDVSLGEWSDEPDENGVKTRLISYTLSINYSLGPKCSPSSETQVAYSL